MLKPLRACHISNFVNFSAISIFSFQKYLCQLTPATKNNTGSEALPRPVQCMFEDVSGTVYGPSGGAYEEEEDQGCLIMYQGPILYSVCGKL